MRERASDIKDPGKDHNDGSHQGRLPPVPLSNQPDATTNGVRMRPLMKQRRFFFFGGQQNPTGIFPSDSLLSHLKAMSHGRPYRSASGARAIRNIGHGRQRKQEKRSGDFRRLHVNFSVSGHVAISITVRKLLFGAGEKVRIQCGGR